VFLVDLKQVTSCNEKNNRDLRFAKPFSIQFEVTLLAVKLFKSAVEELSLTISRIFA